MTPKTDFEGETALEIDLNAVTHNFHYLKSKLSADTKFMAVVKANSYGSDASEIALELEKQGADYFAVAYSGEGEQLRKNGLEAPILVLHALPANFESIVQHQLEPSIYSKRTLRLFLEFAEKHNLHQYPVHLKINTGLNRLGFEPEEVAEIAQIISEHPQIRVASIFSHLAASEDDREIEFTENQIKIFEDSAEAIAEILGYKPLFHCTNTAAIARFPEIHLDMVRSGIGLYGYTYDPVENSQLKPIATLKTVISQIHNLSPGESVGYNRGFIAEKPTISATLALGHADGIPRSLGKGRGWVMIDGKKAPILGNVCMDMIMVDVSDVSCFEGQEVIVFGPDAPADTLALAGGTISYELLTGISPRIKRKFIKD